MNSSEIDSYCPKNQSEWRKWLEQNHIKKSSVWLIIYKKASSSPNLSWSEAVDEALCFGWIDSTKRSIDAEKYMQYFGKRKPESTWSKVNKDKIERLIDQGLMSAAGFKSIEIAKQNGSWSILDDVEALKIPEDLEAEFSRHPKSKDFFMGLNKTMKKGLLYWIVAAKRKETRNKRIVEIVQKATVGLLPKQFSTMK